MGEIICRTRPVPLCHFVTFPPHCGGIFPKPPDGAKSKPKGWVAAARTYRDTVPMRNGISATGRERSAIC